MVTEVKRQVQVDEIREKAKELNGKNGANYETAITACGYGKFHYFMFLAVIPASWASVFDSSNMSMIIATAECDLGLTLYHKGVLNGITYAGMVSSAFLWGFIADVMGRRPILVYGFLADGICNFLCGLLSYNFTSLVIFKFLSGFIISGPYATIMTYCAEFYATKDRPRVTLSVGFSVFFGCIMNAALAWLVVPQDWYVRVPYINFIYKSWSIYLILCGIPTTLGSLGFSFFPESPKFLMSQGRNDEALEVLKTVYSVNTGKPSEQYPGCFYFFVRLNTSRTN